MDQLDALRAFIAVAEDGSFVAASRRVGRSPAAVTRAVAALEDRLGTRLLNRTTRAVALTDAGTRALDLGRRALAEIDALERSAATEQSQPSGLLTITAPEMFGRLHVLPIVRDYLRDHSRVEISLLLLDRVISFVDEGVDLGFRIAHLPDSTLRAIRVGSVRRVTCASPGYLAERGTPQTPEDLAGHDTIAVAAPRPQAERWSFGGPGTPRVAIRSRLAVNTIQAGVDAAVAGAGIVRVLSYQAAPLAASGRLRVILEPYEPPPIPIHIVHPAGRYLPPKQRRFIDRAAATLREKFADPGTG